MLLRLSDPHAFKRHLPSLWISSGPRSRALHPPADREEIISQIQATLSLAEHGGRAHSCQSREGLKPTHPACRALEKLTFTDVAVRVKSGRPRIPTPHLIYGVS